MKKFTKKAFALLCAIVMVGAMLPTSALAAGTDSGVTLNKSATGLDENDQTTVTLQIGATQTTTAADVVFVLDKSTSVNVKNEALAMLDELKEQAAESNITVKVGLVTFNNNANNEGYNMPLTELTDESYSTLSSIFDKSLSSGTNIEAGIRAGMAMLEDDKSVLTENKHLVLVTDGATYLWGTDAPYTIYNQFVHKDNPSGVVWSSLSIAAGVVNKIFFKITQQDYVDSFSDPKTWMTTNSAIAETISKYQVEWPVSDPGSDSSKYISIQQNTGYVSSDAALYMVGKAWEDAVDAGYQLYAFASDKYDRQPINEEGHYPWAAAFISNLDTIGGFSTEFTDDATKVDGMFNGVKNSVLYEIQKGTVTDVVGDCFDLVGTETFKLAIDGTDIARDETPATDYDVSFDDGNYGINYDSGTDSFTWDINIPVEAGTALTLSYTLKLNEGAVAQYKTDNSIPEYATFDVPTNESATLEYETTTGEEKSEDFNKPTITLGDKESEPSLDKTSSSSDSIGNVTPGNNVYFELNSNLPESLASYVVNTGTEDEPDYQITDRQAHLMVFHDTMSSNLIFNQDSLVVKIENTTLPSSYYQIKTENIGDETFTVTVDLAAAFNAGYITLEQLEKAAPIVVTYRAQLSSSAEDGDKISNSAYVNDSEVDTITGEVSDPDTPPATGGMGTALFTVGGVALLAAAGALYVVSRKKNENA